MRELSILQHIYAQNRRLDGRVILPPGDDMGAVDIGGQCVLVTVDQLADGVHFNSAAVPLERIGRKAVTRNLSDVAAMAALPVAAVAAACLPRAFSDQQARRLFDAMRETAAHFQCPLIGGDISAWDHPLVITVTILAEPAGIEPVRRSGAAVGDVVCVTGRLGGSWSHDESGGPHLDFEPRVGLARKLAKLPGVNLHSMIDLSDGLAGDLVRICELSGVAAEIQLDSLPLRPEALAASSHDGRPAWHHAMTDGEDYELCFTLSPESASRLPARIDDVPITRVGRIIAPDSDKPDTRLWSDSGSGRRVALELSGWEHHSDE
jgi:thiamine-monophosphate kinase